MLKIGNEIYEIIYHYVYNGECSVGLYIPFMLKKVDD